MNLIPDRREFFLCADHVRIRLGTMLGDVSVTAETNGMTIQFWRHDEQARELSAGLAAIAEPVEIPAGKGDAE